MTANVRYSNPPGLARMPGYNHVAEVTGPCRTIYIAGQLGYGPDNKRAGAPGDFAAQCTQAFENLKIALAHVGAGFEHVVKVNTFMVDVHKHVSIYRGIRDKYIHPDFMPPSTSFGVPALARGPDALFEIEIVAVLPLNK